IMTMSKMGFRGPPGAGQATRFKPGVSGNPKGRPRKNTLKFRGLIESGRRTRWRPGQSGDPKGRPPNGVMTPTRQRRKSQQEWREFRELKGENLQFKLDFKMAHGLGGARRGAGKRKAVTITVSELSQHVAAQLFHDRGEPGKRLSTKERWEKL